MIYGKKNGGHRAFKRVKSLRSSQSDPWSILRDYEFANSREQLEASAEWLRKAKMSLVL